MSERTPWGRWLAAAFAAGLTPEAFWRLSLKEWRALLGPRGAMDRAGFEALARRFPDQER